MGEVYINKQPTASNFSYVYSENSNGELVRISKDTLVQLIAEQVGVSGDISGTVDANNTITVTHSLPNGNYTLVYENSDGTTTTIGTLVVEGSTSSGEGDVSGNLVRTSIGTDKKTYNNGLGYKDGYRLNSSGQEVAITNGNGSITGFIDIDDVVFDKDKLYVKGIKWDNSYPGNCYIAFYDSSFEVVTNGTQKGSVSEANFRAIASDKLTSEGNINGWYFASSWGLDLSTAKYMRISGAGNGANYIVKINEEI